VLQVQTSIGETLPVSLVLLTNGKEGRVVFVKTGKFDTIIDLPEDGGIGAIFDMDGFGIGEEEYDYNVSYPYKDIPDMLKWLQQQQMVMPEIKLF
jgi:hypothetical protein